MSQDPSELSTLRSELDLAEQMKLGMRQWVSGIAVVAALDPAGKPHAMTVSSMTSVSDNPPSLLVCINKNARMADVLSGAEVSGDRKLFTVNLLANGHEDISNICANSALHDQRFSKGKWHFGGLPRLSDALSVFECETSEIIPYGTHLVILSNILSVHLAEAVQEPLCYWNCGYRRIVTE
jgi:flavin reductase (DIM6/NTAB) family NADH-FMN oxidoreductase RutF